MSNEVAKQLIYALTAVATISVVAVVVMATSDSPNQMDTSAIPSPAPSFSIDSPPPPTTRARPPPIRCSRLTNPRHGNVDYTNVRVRSCSGTCEWCGSAICDFLTFACAVRRAWCTPPVLDFGAILAMFWTGNRCALACRQASGHLWSTSQFVKYGQPSTRPPRLSRHLQSASFICHPRWLDTGPSTGTVPTYQATILTEK